MIIPLSHNLSTKIRIIIDVAREVVDLLKDIFSKGDKEKLNKMSYRQNAEFEQQIALENALKSLKNKAALRAGEIEDELIDTCEINLSKMIDFLDMNGVSIKSLSRAQNVNSRRINGAIKRHIIANLSLDNEELREILSRPASASKSDDIEHFLHSIIVRGVKNLGEEISFYFNNEIENIKESIKSKAEKEHTRLQDSLKHLETLKNAHDISTKQQAQLKLQDLLWQNDLVLKFLQNEA